MHNSTRWCLISWVVGDVDDDAPLKVANVHNYLDSSACTTQSSTIVYERKGQYVSVRTDWYGAESFG